MTVKYVKLSSVFQDRAIADIDGGTLWSISGLTVAEYPEDNPGAAVYVDNMIRKAVLVEATEAEFEAHEALNADIYDFMTAMHESKMGHQESTVQEYSAAGTNKLVQFFNGGDEPEFGQASDGSSTRPDTSAGASEGEEPKFKGKTAQELVDDNSKDELIAMADEEGVDSSGTKQDIADRLVSV